MHCPETRLFRLRQWIIVGIICGLAVVLLPVKNPQSAGSQGAHDAPKGQEGQAFQSEAVEFKGVFRKKQGKEESGGFVRQGLAVEVFEQC